MLHLNVKDIFDIYFQVEVFQASEKKEYRRDSRKRYSANRFQFTESTVCVEFYIVETSQQILYRPMSGSFS